MKTMQWLALVVGSSLLSGFISWKVNTAPGAAVDLATDLTSADLYREATLLLQSPPSRLDRDALATRVSLVVDMARRRQVAHPAETLAAWDQYEHVLPLLVEQNRPAVSGDDTIARADRELALLLRYEDDLETAAGACRSLADIDVICQVHEEVVARIEVHRTQLLTAVRSHLAEFATQLATKNCAEALDDFATLKPTFDDALVTLIGSSKPDGDTGLASIVQVVGTLQKRTDDEIRSIRHAADRYAETLRNGQRVDPAVASLEGNAKTSGAKGACQEQLDRLNSISAALDRCDMTGWLNIARRIETEDKGGTSSHDAINSDAGLDPVPLERAVAEASAEHAHLQQLAYNLWALREILAAEDTDSWEDRLGVIDVGFLHPTVGALYSSAYGRRIEGSRDPSARAEAAQRVLSTPKNTLQSF
jgi:hypothetical protein